MKCVEVFTTRLGNNHHIFQTHAAKSSAIEAGFDGKCITNHELGSIDVQQGRFVGGTL